MLRPFFLVLLLAVAAPACSGAVANAPDGGVDARKAVPDAHEGVPDAGNGAPDAAPDGHPSRDGALPPPTEHRPTAVPCSTTRPPGVQDGGIYYPNQDCCMSDSECPATTDAGTNGRCTPRQSGPVIMCAACEYDCCFTDSQCPGEDVCVCGGSASIGRSPNYCSPGDCRVDSDCGLGGYCSPSYYPCSGGLAGYYCHTPGDECTTDAQCSPGFGNVCEWNATSMAWTCVQQACPG